jgi:hypothetical protein
MKRRLERAPATKNTKTPAPNAPGFSRIGPSPQKARRRANPTIAQGSRRSTRRSRPYVPSRVRGAVTSRTDATMKPCWRDHGAASREPASYRCHLAAVCTTTVGQIESGDAAMNAHPPAALPESRCLGWRPERCDQWPARFRAARAGTVHRNCRVRHLRAACGGAQAWLLADAGPSCLPRPLQGRAGGQVLSFFQNQNRDRFYEH